MFPCSSTKNPNPVRKQHYIQLRNKNAIQAAISFQNNMTSATQNNSERWTKEGERIFPLFNGGSYFTNYIHQLEKLLTGNRYDGELNGNKMNF